MWLRRAARILAITLMGCDARSRYELGTFVGERIAAFEIGGLVVLTAIVAAVGWRLALASRRRRRAIEAALRD
jgi:hypothetical protein